MKFLFLAVTFILTPMMVFAWVKYSSAFNSARIARFVTNSMSVSSVRFHSIRVETLMHAATLTWAVLLLVTLLVFGTDLLAAMVLGVSLVSCVLIAVAIAGATARTKRVSG